MKKFIILLVLLPMLSFSQVEVKNFNTVFLQVKENKVTDVKKADTKVTIFEKHISVRYLDGLFMFQIVAEIPNERNVTILLVNSIRQNSIKVVYDKNNTAMSFEYNDRMIMFFNKEKLNQFKKLHKN